MKNNNIWAISVIIILFFNISCKEQNKNVKIIEEKDPMVKIIEERDSMVIQKNDSVIKIIY
ncbi:MAG: hypothetical protein N3A01_05840 [Bacteroidales bacterium]|nr:hypothetical protein [Bacteroidales bacterium]